MAEALPQPGSGQRSQSKFIVFEKLQKMNTQSVRQSLAEDELAWQENLQPIAPNNMVAVPAVAATALATLAQVATVVFYAVIGGVDYFICFTTGGAGYAVTISNGAIGQFAPNGTFSDAPDATTWQASRLLINDPTAGYCTWDGTLFVRQGGVSPNITVTNGGSGYGTPPSVTISGGSGTGATAVAVVSNGVIVAIDLTAPGRGYQAGDTLTVTIGTSPGSGAAGHVTMTGAPITGLQLVNGGDFNTPTTGNVALSFSGGGGSGAAGYAIVVPKSFKFTIQSLVLTSVGSGYSSPPTVSLPGLGGATINPSIQASLGTESVATIVLDAGGSSYTAAPAVTITPSDGNGSGAAATATEAGGAVTALALNASAVVTLAIAVQGVSSSPPGTYNLSFSGGGGTGAAGTVTIGNYTNNSGGTSVGVISYVLSNGGSGYTTAPSVSVSGASFSVNPTIQAFIASQGAGYDLTPAVVIGSGTGATAIAHVWPYVPAGNTIAVFQGRVWLNGLNTVSGQFNILQWTGTGASYGNVGYDDFLAADASASLIISDADLIHAITALRSFNNYLWIMGDQSVKQIGNISLNSSGDVTLFTILTLSSDQGTVYPKSCLSYNRVFMFANNNGIFGAFGSSVQKLSSDLDGIFKLVNFSLAPQSAVVDLNAIHNAVFLVSYNDPSLGTRTILLMFDGKRWFVCSQGNALTAIATFPSATTGQNSLYGIGNAQEIIQLFGNPSGAVNFKLQTALTHHGNAVQGKKAIRAGFSSNVLANSSVTMSVDTEAANGSALTMDIDSGFSVVGGANDANDNPIQASGIYLGLTISGTLAGFTLTNAIAEYQETSLWKGA